MVVISAIEVWKGTNVFYWTANGLPSDDIVKAALPIAIAAAGGIEWLMCAIGLYYACCCQHSAASSSTVVTTTTTNTYPEPVMVNNATYERPGCQPCAAARHPQPQLPPPSSCQPCAAKQNFYSAGGMGGGMGMGGGLGGGMGGGCSSCPRPTTYNNFSQMAPNPAYNFYRS